MTHNDLLAAVSNNPPVNNETIGAYCKRINLPTDKDTILSVYCICRARMYEQRAKTLQLDLFA